MPTIVPTCLGGVTNDGGHYSMGLNILDMGRQFKKSRIFSALLYSESFVEVAAS